MCVGGAVVDTIQNLQPRLVIIIVTTFRAHHLYPESQSVSEHEGKPNQHCTAPPTSLQHLPLPQQLGLRRRLLKIRTASGLFFSGS